MAFLEIHKECSSEYQVPETGYTGMDYQEQISENYKVVHDQFKELDTGNYQKLDWYFQGFQRIPWKYQVIPNGNPW